MRYGYAIRIGGDPEISGALKSGMERGRQTKAPTLAPGTGEAVRRVAMHQHTPEEWGVMIAKAQYDYGQDEPAPRWVERLLVAWAMVCYRIARAFRAQDKVLERRD
jgi:hypothetical protein